MRKLIIIGIPHHGNLGDNAIALAEEMMLKQNFSQYEIYQIPEKFLYKCIDIAKEFINKDDVLLLHGGGNIGDTYLVPEEGRRKVIQLFPDNKIIIFPQTAFFEDNEKLSRGHKKFVIYSYLVKISRLINKYNIYVCLIEPST